MEIGTGLGSKALPSRVRLVGILARDLINRVRVPQAYWRGSC